MKRIAPHLAQISHALGVHRTLTLVLVTLFLVFGYGLVRLVTASSYEVKVGWETGFVEVQPAAQPSPDTTEPVASTAR